MEGILDILFEPLKMNNLILKNRFFMAPIGTTLDIERWKDLLIARARGGVAMITTGEICVHPSGRSGPDRELCMESENDIRIFASPVKEIQNAGARIIAQLNHTGRYSLGRLTGKQSVAPSPVASTYTGETPRGLSTWEVDDLVIAFAEAAVRARKAGFDGVEFLGSSGYLVSQFLSPLTNKRTDKYGGDMLKRATFLLSILRETRKMAGSDFNICVKIDAEDSMPGGKTLEDSIFLAPHIVCAGADRLHIWAGWHETKRPLLPMFVPQGAFTYLTAAIKKAVDVPVATVGRINDPYVAAGILRKGEADMVGLGRALLCDPDFVKKTMENRTGEIRRCTACCYCFDELIKSLRGGDAGLKCSLNPELGREGEQIIQAARRKKHVAVVGGGPAGMEAARISAIRGHQVTLIDENDRLGGMLNLAVVPPYKTELKNITDYYSSQMDVLKVNIKLGVSFTHDKLKEIKPDAVILASGADAYIPQIPGLKINEVITALDILKGKKIADKDILVIGGGLIGIETAEFLAEQGKNVTVIEMLRKIALDVGPTSRWGLLSRISGKMNILTSTRVIKVKKRSVLVLENNRHKRVIPASAIVIAAGLKCRTDLIPFLEKSDIEYHIVGSCREPGQIAGAIADAFTTGCKI